MARGNGDLDVTIFTASDLEPIQEDGVEFVSFINDKTFGKPPIIAPGTDDYQRDEADVLFINPANIAAIRVVKG